MSFRVEKDLLPSNLIWPTFTFGAFVDIENQLYGVGGSDFFVSGLHHGELAAMLGEQLLKNHLSVLDDRGIEAALDG